MTAPGKESLLDEMPQRDRAQERERHRDNQEYRRPTFEPSGVNQELNDREMDDVYAIGEIAIFGEIAEIEMQPQKDDYGRQSQRLERGKRDEVVSDQHCHGCGQSVHRADTVIAAEALARRGACISVPAAIADVGGYPKGQGLIVGQPEHPVRRWAGRLFHEPSS